MTHDPSALAESKHLSHAMIRFLALELEVFAFFFLLGNNLLSQNCQEVIIQTNKHLS